MKTISIITASFNSASTITDTLTSVNFQTYPNIEHVVVDGVSKDNTIEIVKALGLRVTNILSERDKGIYDAYNKGLTLVHGDVIGFLNSDDFYSNPDVVTNVMSVFEDESVDAVYADLVYVDRDDVSKITRHWRSRHYKKGLFTKGFVPAHPTMFLRKSVYEKAGYFDLSYRLAADYEFMLRIFHSIGVKSVYVPKVMVKMRNGGATGASLANIRKQNSEIMRALAQHGVSYSPASFMLRKVVDRTAQRLRAHFLNQKRKSGSS